MKYLLSVLVVVTGLLSCNNAKEEPKEKITIPASPTSIQSVGDQIKGKQFHTLQVATVSSFEMDKADPYTWMTEKTDTSSFARGYLAKRMQFSIHFVNDSTASIGEEGKTINALYKIDDKAGEDEQPGIRLRFTYEEKNGELTGTNEPMIVTSTYLVSGIDGNRLLLQAPREYNNRKIAVLLSDK